MNVSSFRRWVQAFSLGIMVGIVLTQCARVRSGELALEETAFQALHLVDMQQTLSLRHHPCVHTKFFPNGQWYDEQCHEEGTGALDAGWAIGKHPSDRAVYGYFAGEGALHAAVSYLLRGRPWAFRTWEAVTIGVQGFTVARNFHLGLQARF
jgi:hypothetical protein